jgi:hypothetical protein
VPPPRSRRRRCARGSRPSSRSRSKRRRSRWTADDAAQDAPADAADDVVEQPAPETIEAATEAVEVAAPATGNGGGRTDEKELVADDDPVLVATSLLDAASQETAARG